MGDTSIEWTNKTWNPTRGCSRVSPGCKNCYAERFAARFRKKGGPFRGFVQITNGHPQWTGKVALVEKMLDLPLRWRKPCRVFVNSMSDLFHESLTDDEIDRVFAVMALCPRHTFQCLTKRPERMLNWFNKRPARWVEFGEQRTMPGFICEKLADSLYGTRHANRSWRDGIWPLPNVWLGVSVENQETANERIPLLLQTPAAVRFVSYEPALGPVDFSAHSIPALWVGKLHWIIVGGESGPGARPFDIWWARNTVKQCRDAGTACFVKQLGAKPMYRAHGEDNPRHLFNGLQLLHSNGYPLRDKKGGTMEEWPADLRVREFPR